MAKLSDICELVNQKIKINVAINNNLCNKYISTENMLPNKQGISVASNIPSSGSVTLYRKDDTLVSNIRPYFKKIWLAEDDSCCSNDVLVFRAKNNYSSDYIYYTLANDTFFNYAMKTSKGTKMPRGDKKSIMNYDITLLDTNTQVKTTAVLKRIDAKIDLNNKINNNLEQQAQAIFKSWFVDFEPFNGTMPSDWEIVPLEKIADFQNGYAFKSKELLNEPSSDCYQVFKQGHIARGGGFIPDGTKSWYPKRLASKLEKFVLKKSDILMAMTDMKDNVAILGNTAIMPLDNEYIVNQRVGHLRANGYKGVTYPFIYLLTNSTDFLVDLRSRANSGVQVNLSSSEVKASQTVLPSEEVNNAFSEITLPMFEIIINNQLENHRLAQLRDTLLPKLMSGELDVSDIEI